MSANVVNQVAYLRTSREFEKNDVSELSKQLNKTYLDIANVVNVRTIGIYAANRPSINGKGFFLTNQKQQGLQQIYPFTNTTSIPHGLNFSSVERIITAYGSYSNALGGGNWYGLIFGDFNAIPGQVSFYIDPTNIVFVVGAGSPVPVKGTVVIEWISNI